MLGDSSEPGEEPEKSSDSKASYGQLIKVPSVAAQKFKRNVSEEPTASPMFSSFSVEEPRPSEHAASLYVPGSSGHSSGSMDNKGTADAGTVKFTVGEF